MNGVDTTMARKVGAAREKLRHVEGREPSIESIATEVGTTPEHDLFAQQVRLHDALRRIAREEV